ncbi:MAG: helix-turn-helix transcriptional regulator [Nitrospinae bacterium]|nr:helix-turn-helix transcriptional regulator [Nitrospinota bacterium]
MWVQGHVRKRGKFWLVDFPALDAATQGMSKAEAYDMARDLVETLADIEGFKLSISITAAKGSVFYAGADDAKSFAAFLLRRWRQTHGLTLEEAASRLGSRSLNAYSRYEKGRNEPTISMMEKLVEAISPKGALQVYFGNPA